MKVPSSSHSECLLLAVSFLVAGSCFAQRGPVPGLNVSTPYLIHYGNWTPTLVNQARDNYRLVILHPSVSNITPADIANIRSGPDTILGNTDDVRVLAYISVGEDDRPSAPVAGDMLGPRVDPRPSYSDPLDDSINPLGSASGGGNGFASYYLDDEDSDGQPDQNSIFGGYYVNPGDPAWLQVLITQTKASDQRAGLNELLTTTYGAGYGCDGLFLDTLDTPAPNSFGATQYEWTAKAYRDLVQDIGDLHPTKLLLANRGVFFYNPNLKTYKYTLRPHIDLLMYESYYTDSSGSGAATAFFDDNKFNFAPKINAEAARPDGFTVVALGYTSPGESAGLVEQDFVESQQEQGWMLYRTNPQLDATPFNTQAAIWNAAHPDTSPPVWDSTAAQGADSDPNVSGNQAPAPRVGVQELSIASGGVTVRWDVARDQSGPVKYAIYYTSDVTMNFGTATKISDLSGSGPSVYTKGTGEGRYANEHTITGLANGTSYLFAVRAVDHLGNEDTNTVTLEAAPGGSVYKTITIDGDFSDWSGVPVYATDPVDGVTVDYQNVQVANDDDYLYVRFTLHAAASPFSDFNTHLFIDADADPASGYPLAGAPVGSEIMLESGIGYDQRGGGYNEGGSSGLNWLIAPAGPATSFEFRVSRAATFSTGGAPVFSQDMIRLALQDNRGDTTASIAYEFAAPQSADSYYAAINVDGDDSDWTGIPVAYMDPVGDGAPDIVSVQVVNDDDFLYLLVRYSGSVDTNTFNGSPSTFVSVDHDADPGTGYNIYGLGELGAEVSWQNNFAFSQDAGNFNSGGVFINAVPDISPYQTNTSFQEYRIPRDATYSVGGGPSIAVFPGTNIRLAVWTDSIAPTEFAGGFGYHFAGNPGITVYEKWKYNEFTASQLSDPQISGNQADHDADGLNTLIEFALGGDPVLTDAHRRPMAGLTSLSGSDYLDFTYFRRILPSGMDYLPEVSVNMDSWDASPGLFMPVSVTPADTGFESVKVRLASPVGNARAFIRLRTVLEP